MKKLRARQIRNTILKKLFNPVHIARMISLSRKKKGGGRSSNDAQLKLYAKVLNGGFLHYGYFENPGVEADSISLKDFYQAQHLYAEQLLKHVDAGNSAVLDVGCGLGGLMHMLAERGFKVVGLTPDRYQTEFIRKTYSYELIHSKFEKLEAEAYKQSFGTVINSESLQYIKLDQGLPVLDTIMKPGGKWIISDYFRTREAHEKSGHYWDVFLGKIDAHNLQITYEQDITDNIRPTLAFLHMWGSRFGMPLFEFLTEKIQRKAPALDYLLDETLQQTRSYLEDHIRLIEPEQFMSDKRYMILVVERKK